MNSKFEIRPPKGRSEEFGQRSKADRAFVQGLVYLRKLDVALRGSRVQEFMHRLNKRQDLHKHETAFLETLKSQHGVSADMISANHHIYPDIIMQALSSNTMPTTGIPWVQRALRIAKKNIELQIQSLMRDNDPAISVTGRQAYEEWQGRMETLPQEILKVGLLVEEWQLLVDSMGRCMVSVDEARTMPKSSMHVLWTRNLLVTIENSRVSLLPREYALLIYNKLCDTFSILLLAYSYDGSVYEDGCFARTIEFLQEYGRLAKKHQQQFFGFAKVLESIVTAMTLLDTDGPDNREFYENLIRTIQTEVSIIFDYSRIFSILSNCSIPFRHELGCLSKIMGHPFVDMEKGARKLHQRTCEHLPVNTQAVNECVRHAKKQFIKGYIEKHGKWPVVEMDYHIHPGLARAALLNKDPDSLSVVSTCTTPIVMSDYDFVELQPCMEFNELENFIPYLKDRTVSIMRSEVLDHYIHKTNDRRPSWKETRLLLWYLMNPENETDHIPYLHRYAQSDNLEELMNYLVIRIVPKEKELKTDFRGFGCKTPQERARSIVQETNAMMYLDLYSSEQAMTLTELDILKRLRFFRFIKNCYENYVPLYIVVDSTGWNNKFRHAAVSPVMREVVDKVFGSHIFEKTMLAFEKSLIYVPDGKSVYWWDGQFGGIEGLNQDTWVITYISQIHAALEGLNMKYHLFCKGDDMRIVVMVPPDLAKEPGGLLRIKNEVIRRIKDFEESVGQQINQTESYGSTNYFAFSKTTSIRSIEMPQTFRKGEKLYGANNAFLNFVDDYIGSSFSNAHSTCAVGIGCVGPYWAALMWSCYYLLQDVRYQNLTDTQLSSLLLVPSMLGGFPIIYLHNMMVRAESDLLSPFIQLIQDAERYDPELRQHMLTFLRVTLIDSERAFEGLLRDPYSLPVKKPVSPGTSLRNKVGPALLPYIRNTEIVRMFSLASSRDMEALIRTLYSCNVYNPKLMSAIYAASPKGLLESFLRKFETGRSIYEVLVMRWGMRRTARILSSVMAQDARLQDYRVAVLTSGVAYTHDFSLLVGDMCCAELAQHIRVTSWGRPIEGITMAPVKHLAYMVTEEMGEYDAWARANHFRYTFLHARDTVDRFNLPGFSVGGALPFTGYTTKSGLVDARVHFVEKNEILEKVKVLIDLLAWVRRSETLHDGTYIESNLHEVIYCVLKLYLDIPPEALTPFGGARRSGTIMHHVRAPHYRESIVPNSLSNIYQNMIGDTNTHNTLRASSGHYKVNFLQIYCHMVSMFHLPLNFIALRRRQDMIFWVVTTKCPYCSTPIRESVIVCTLDPQLVYPTSLNISKLKISSNTLDIIMRSLASDPRRFLRRGIDQDELNIEYCYLGIMSDFIKITSANQERIKDRYTQHEVSYDTYRFFSELSLKHASREVGTTELIRIPIRSVVSHLIPLVVIYCYRTHAYSTTEDISAYFLVNPGANLPWYIFLHHFHRAGRLGELINYLALNTGVPVPPVYDSPSGAAPYVGYCVFLLSERMQTVNICMTYLTEHEAVGLMSSVNNHATILKHRICLKHLYEDYGHTSRMEDSRFARDTREVLAQLIIMIWACPEYDEGEIELLIGTTEANRTQLLYPLHYERITREVIGEMAYLEYRPALLSVFMKKNSNLPWLDIIRKLENSYPDREEVYRTYTDEVTISVCVTSKSTCINRIRSQDPINPVAKSRQVEVTYTHDLRYRAMKMDKNRFVINRRMGDMAVSNNLWIPENVNIWVKDKIAFCRYYYYRQLSHGTSATNKLLQILHILEIQELPDACSYLCLADGYGGFTATISSLTNNSYIGFNTLIDTKVMSETRPHSALTPLIQRQNEIDYDLVLESISDLTRRATVELLEKSHRRYLVITCDAQTVEMDMDNRHKLLSHVSSYYLRNRSVNGILVIKLYMNETAVNLRMIRFLSAYVLDLTLFKPPASGLNQEIYLIGRGTRQAYLGSLRSSFPDVWPDLITSTNLCTYLTRLQTTQLEKLIEKEKQFTYQSFEGCHILLPQLHFPAFHVHAGRVFGCMIETYMVTQNIGDHLKEVIDRLHRHITTILSLMHGPVMFTQRQSYDSDTFAHHRIEFDKICASKGAIFILTQWTPTHLYVAETRLRQDFMHSCASMGKRFGFNLQSGKIFCKSHSIHGVSWTPYKSYISGCHLALGYIGYLSRLRGTFL
jgi:hypothetical protein